MAELPDDLATLKYLIDETPACRALLQAAHLAAREGHTQAAWIIVAAVADAITATHPGVVPLDQSVTLRDALGRFFTD